MSLWRRWYSSPDKRWSRGFLGTGHAAPAWSARSSAQNPAHRLVECVFRRFGEGLSAPGDEIIGPHQQRGIRSERGELCPSTVDVSDVSVGANSADVQRKTE